MGRDRWVCRLVIGALLASAGAAARAQPIPDALGGASTGEIVGDRERAETTLSEVVERALAGREAPDPPDEGAQSDPRAARYYARGRTLLLGGQAAAAAAALRRAAELAPDSPSAWRELGMAQVATNDRAAAAESLARAVSLGADDARLLFVLGSLELARGRLTEGIDLLALAAGRDPGAQDGSLSPLVHVSLGEALHAGGWIRAGNEAIEIGIADLGEIRNRSVYETEAGRLYPRRGRLMRVVGDNWLRLGEHGRAASAYASAWRYGVPVYDAVVSKHVIALSREGRAEEAVERLLAAMEDAGSRLDERLIETIGLLDRDAREIAAERLGGRLAEPGLAPTVRGWLTRALARARGGESGREGLRRWLGERPTDLEALRDLIAMHDDDAGLAREMSRLVELDPLLALEAGRIVAVRGGERVVEELGRFRTKSGSVTRGALLLAMHRPAEALEAISGVEGPGAAAVNALALHDMGRLDLAVFTLERRLEPSLLRVWTLARMQRRVAAAEGAAALFEGEAGESAMGMWLDVAPLDLSRRRGPEVARRLLEHDAADARALALLVREAPEEGIERLRSEAGGLRLRRLMAAERALALGERAEAERALTMLALEAEESGREVDLLASVWMSARGSDREPTLERGIALVERLLERRPGDPAFAIARARFQEMLGRREQAIVGLRESLERTRSPLVRRELEDAMLRDSALAAQAREMRIERLALPSPTVGERVERAVQAIDSGDLEGALRELRGLEGVSLSGPQSAVLVSSLRRLGARIAQEPEGSDRAAAIELLDLSVELDAALPRAVHELRLALLATLEPLEVERIVGAAAESALLLGPEPADEVVITPVRYLLSERRLGDGLALIEAIAGEVELSDAEVVDAWVRLIVSEGGAENLRRMLERVLSDEALRSVFGESPAGSTEELSGDELRAEIAFQIGTAFASVGKQDAALASYELGLSYEPTHPWCANNLGYSLLEERRDVERAERLIEIAHEQLPGNDSILDSLGWARYLRGQMHDEPGLDGEPPKLGAVTLLERAVEIGGEDASAVGLDHLGDALWRAGERERSIATWERARDAAVARIGEIEGQVAAEHPTLVELRAVEAAVSAKIVAGRAGEEPAVAPLVGGGVGRAGGG